MMLAAGMVVLALVTFAAMFGFIDLCDRCVGDVMTMLSLVLSVAASCTWCTRCCGRRSSEASMGTEYVAVVFTILFTIATSVLLGRYMSRCSPASARCSTRCFVPIERLVLRAHRRRSATSSRTGSATRSSLLISNVVMWLATFAIVTLQQVPAAQPDGIGNMEPTLAFNTISSFVTNTNLQHYSGETGPVVLLADVRDHVPAVRDRGDRHGGVQSRSSAASPATG